VKTFLKGLVLFVLAVCAVLFVVRVCSPLPSLEGSSTSRALLDTAATRLGHEAVVARHGEQERPAARQRGLKSARQNFLGRQLADFRRLV